MTYARTNKELRILLADDDEDDRLFFTDTLEEIDINTTVETVNDGQQLMEYLCKPNAVLPDLLFLDLNMPRKSGIECLNEIRANDALKNIIIAIYSTSDAEKDIDSTFHKGANIYITKPNDFQKLKKVIIEAININWQQRNSAMDRANYRLVV